MRLSWIGYHICVLALTLFTPSLVLGADAPSAGATAPPTPKPAVKPAPKPLAVGDRIEGLWGGNWYTGAIVKKEGTRFVVKYDDGSLGTLPPEEIRAAYINDPKFLGGLKKGSIIQAFDKHLWLGATVVNREAARFFVHYDGHPPALDEWVTPDRIRPSDFIKGSSPADVAAAEAAAALALANSKTKFTVGQRVEVNYASEWMPGVIAKAEGDRYTVKTDYEYETPCSSAELRPGRPLDFTFIRKMAVGQEVLVRRLGSWTNATVVKLELERVFIHYARSSDSGDEWVGPNRIRTLLGVGTTGAQSLSDPIPTGNFSEVKDAPLVPGPWAVKPDAIPAQTQPLSARRIPLIEAERFSKKDRQAERVVRTLFTSLPAAQALIVYHDDALADPDDRGRYQRLNLLTGQPMENVLLEHNRDLVAMSPGGTQGIARVRIRFPDRSGWDGPDNSSVQLLQLAGGKCLPGLQWRPYDPDTTLTDIQFTDEAHLLSMSKEGFIVYWQLPATGAKGPPKALYRLRAGPGMRPFLSPGQKYFVVADPAGLRFVDTASGQTLGVIAEIQGGVHEAISFKNDGLTAALSIDKRVLILHLTTGRIIRVIPIPQDLLHESTIDWLDAGHLLLGQSHVVDVSKRLVTWGYHIGRQVKPEVYGGRVWFSSSIGKPEFCSAVLPHDEALKAEPPLKVEDLFVFKPGTKVVVDVSIDASEAMKAKIKTSLENQLQAMQLTIVPEAPLHVQAIVENGFAKKLEYRPVGERVIKEVSVNDKKMKLMVTLDGQELWKDQSLAEVARFLTLKKDETVEQAIANGQAHSYGWLSTIELPKLLMNSKTYKLAGWSEVTARGITPYTPPAK